MKYTLYAFQDPRDVSYLIAHENMYRRGALEREPFDMSLFCAVKINDSADFDSDRLLWIRNDLWSIIPFTRSNACKVATTTEPYLTRFART